MRSIQMVIPLALLLAIVVSGVPARGAEGPEQAVLKRAGTVPWQPVGLSGGGAMFTPAVSPVDGDIMMLNCDMSGAYISTNGGRDWRMIHAGQLRSNTRVKPGMHPHDAGIIYAARGNRLFVSRDTARTFEPVGSLQESFLGEIAICPDQPELMLSGARGGGIRVSRDGGKTWSQATGPSGPVVAFHFNRTTASQTLFAATEEGIWRSDDMGASWAEKSLGLPWAEIQGFDGGSKGEQVMLYCTVRSKIQNGQFAGGIYRSTDRGESWEWAMGSGTNRDTQQTGEWAAGEIAQYVQVLCSDAAPMTVYVTNTSTGFHPPHTDSVYRSDDGGQNWRLTYFEDPRFEDYNVAPNYVTTSTGQAYKGGGVPTGIAISETDPQRIILTRGQVQITHDGGASWFNGHTYPPEGVTPGPGTPWVCNGLVVTTTWHYYRDPHESNRHYIAYTDIGLARSLDRGETWIWWEKGKWADWRNTCYEIAFDPDVPGKMWGAFSNVHDIPNDNIISERHSHRGPGGVALSRDWGETWHVEAEGLPGKPVTSIVVDPGSRKGQRILYAGVFGGGVYRSVDDGRTWEGSSSGLGHDENMRVHRVLLHEDGTLFAAITARRPGRGQPLKSQGVGLYRSTDRAESWSHINASKPLLYIKDFSVHPDDSNHILLAACDSRRGSEEGGLYRTRNGGRSWERIGRQGSQTFGGYFHPTFASWIYMSLTEGAPGPGLWLSRDDGETWEPFEDLPFTNAQRVEIAPSDDEATMFLTTFGGSVWKGPIAPH